MIVAENKLGQRSVDLETIGKPLDALLNRSNVVPFQTQRLNRVVNLIHVRKFAGATLQQGRHRVTTCFSIIMATALPAAPLTGYAAVLYVRPVVI